MIQATCLGGQRDALNLNARTRVMMEPHLISSLPVERGTGIQVRLCGLGVETTRAPQFPDTTDGVRDLSRRPRPQAAFAKEIPRKALLWDDPGARVLIGEYRNSSGA
jgi:hypothetical protein